MSDMLYASGLLPEGVTLDELKQKCNVFGVVDDFANVLSGIDKPQPAVYIEPQLYPIHYDYIHAAWEPRCYWTDDDGGLGYADDRVKVSGVWFRPADPDTDFPQCDWCDEHRPVLGPIEVYDSPWDNTPKVLNICSSCLYDRTWMDSNWTDFHYEYCEWCEREIIVRCPSNGWHEYFKYSDDNDGCYPMCLRCYEDGIKENGQPRDNFENRKGEPRTNIKGGMFLNPNEWLIPGGWERVEDAPGFISGGSGAERYNKCAIALIDAGHVVLTEYERMGIGGSEGYVQLWSKEKIGELNEG
jgi:hypothetical protein